MSSGKVLSYRRVDRVVFPVRNTIFSVGKRFTMHWSRFRPRGIVLLAAVAIAVAAIWGFAEIADEVLEGETLTFDEKLVRWMRRPEAPAMLKGPQWLHEVGRDVTALGSYAVLSLVTLAVGSFLFLQRRYRTAVLVVAAAAGGG
jgi:undecaprenyl-diphosphatase